MRTLQPSVLLRRAFVADAAATGLVALAQLADTDALVGLLGLPRALLVESGAFLVAYVLLLALLARAPRLPSALVLFIVVGNVGWALGATALWIDHLVAPTAPGIAWLAAQAIATLVLAAWEYAGWKASTAVGGAAVATPRPNW